MIFSEVALWIARTKTRQVTRTHDVPLLILSQEMPSVDDSEEENQGLEEDEASENGSFASVDNLDGTSLLFSTSLRLISFLDGSEGREHLLELSQLAEKDPEFYKYLQENDKELLEFNPNIVDEEDQDTSELEDDSIESVPVLTKDILLKWQKALLEVRVIVLMYACI
jgi:nucleolar complex protein 2